MTSFWLLLASDVQPWVAELLLNQTVTAPVAVLQMTEALDKRAACIIDCISREGACALVS